jgi:hypothetical protein
MELKVYLLSKEDNMYTPNQISIVEQFELPDGLAPRTAYRLLPCDRGEEYFRERTDRNLGWISWEEQELLRSTVIGVAGCGGMGGQLAEKFLRLGVGEVRIADSEVFDASNLNRQFAVLRNTLGKSKALETARML